MKKNIYFTEDQKLADLLIENYRLLTVFPYFDIALGFGEKTVRQICVEKNISLPLFLLVCNVSSFDDYIPSEDIIKKTPAKDFVDYLRISHIDYIEHRIPHIINHIYDLVSDIPKRHGEMLVEFCEKYRADVTAHFQEEEEHVYKYILTGDIKKLKTRRELGGNHNHLETTIHDLKNIIIKYIPENKDIEYTRANVLIYLCLFEQDLEAHTRLEDTIFKSIIDNL